jgi:hypothetical protein
MKVTGNLEPSSTARPSMASPSRNVARIRLPAESADPHSSPIGKHGGLLVRRRQSIEILRSPKPLTMPLESVDMDGGDERIRSQRSGPTTTHGSSIGSISSHRPSMEKARSARTMTEGQRLLNGDELEERDRSQRTIHATSPTCYVGTVARLRESMQKLHSARVLKDELTLLDGTEENGQDASERTSDSPPIGVRPRSRRNMDSFQHSVHVDSVKPRRDVRNIPLEQHDDKKQNEDDGVADESLSELVKKAKMRKKRSEVAQLRDRSISPERLAEIKVDDVVW